MKIIFANYIGSFSGNAQLKGNTIIINSLPNNESEKLYVEIPLEKGPGLEIKTIMIAFDTSSSAEECMRRMIRYGDINVEEFLGIHRMNDNLEFINPNDRRVKSSAYYVGTNDKYYVRKDNEPSFFPLEFSSIKEISRKELYGN